MKTIFVKSGGYYETPGVSVAGAIGDFYGLGLNHYNKRDSTLLLDVVDGKYVLTPPVNDPELYWSFSLDRLTEHANEHGFAYVGVVGDAVSMLRPGELFQNLAIVVLDRETGKFKAAESGLPLQGNNVTTVMYCLKMTTDTYAIILTKLAHATYRVGETLRGRTNPFEQQRVIGISDGDAIRSQFVDLKFTGVRKHFRNNDLVIGYAVFADANKLVEVDIFKSAPFVTPAFKQNLKIEVDSCFHTVVTDDARVLVQMPENRMTGYLSIKLLSMPLYEEVSSREIKETLTFDLSVSVL